MPRQIGSRTPSILLQVEPLEDRCVLSSAAYVTALYKDLLHRLPAPSEVAGYVGLLDSGVSPEQVALTFTSSQEFRTYEVRSDYEMFLNRQPSTAELSGWVGGLQAGVPERQVEASFLASDEFFSHHGGAAASWLDKVYQDVLGRHVDAGGLGFWTNDLQNGASREQAAFAVATSTEADVLIVGSAYHDLLRRLPDPNGLGQWVAALQSGLTPSQLLAAVASSDEFIELRAPGGLDPVSLPAGFIPADIPYPVYAPVYCPPTVLVPADVVYIDPGSESGYVDPFVVDPYAPEVTTYDPGADTGIDPNVSTGD